MPPNPDRPLAILLLSPLALALTVALSAEARAEVPLPKPRPVAATSATAAAATPLPRTRPSAPVPTPTPLVAMRTPTLPPLAVAPTTATSRADIAALARVIDLVQRREPAAATAAQAAIGDPVARKLAEWVILRSTNNGATVERYRAFIAANPGWPSLDFFRRRLEAALWDDRRDDAVVLDWFQNETPLTAKGRLVLARAAQNRGDGRTAARLVRESWRESDLSEAMERAVLDQFGSLITAADHKARMDNLLYDNNAHEAALRAAKRLGAGHLALARARVAVSRRAKNAKALLDAVPQALRGDAGYIFAKIQWLRRNDHIAEAARLMLAAPREPGRLYDLDEWWIERRVLARELLDAGDARSAYLVARDAAVPARGNYRTQHQFTAGWIALRFLHDPATATRHFEQIRRSSSNPTALARAGYWLGRAAEAAGRNGDARAAYQFAAAHATTYYGQLARGKLGQPQMGLSSAPKSGMRGERLEIVRAVGLLYAADQGVLALPIFAELGDTADADALAALGDIAARHDDTRALLTLGKDALNRGLPFEHYAFPVSGIPRYRSLGPDVERSIVYAIARQESGFNPAVVSPAQAYGLMQVTPAAGKYVARRYGTSFDLKRLRDDSPYNVAFGAAELASLLDDYRGSYILTFAGYNAGRGSVRKWIERYGDPRDPKVDAVDWVERIPFSETRNYVQRIMENLQVYRVRFGGGGRLQIDADMSRGSTMQ
jgi:soluble lytic murein transglycosylase